MLSWIAVKDIAIFDFMHERIKLTTDKKDNWYWTFKDSLDVKERLKIDLKDKVSSQRLAKLIESGNVPLMVCKTQVSRISNSQTLSLSLQISNVGNTTAIEPAAILVYGVNNHKDAIAKVHAGGGLTLAGILKSMRPEDPAYTVNQLKEYQDIDNAEESKYQAFLLISYMSIYGDRIIDGSELDITWRNKLQSGYVLTYFRSKELLGGEYFEKLIRSDSMKT